MQQFTIKPADRILQSAWNQTKIVQFIQCHNEERFIQPVLRSIYDEVDEILLIEGATVARPNRTETGHSTDGTVELIHDFIRNEDVDKKVRLIQKERAFLDLEEIKNTFLRHVEDGSWIIINDADEYYEPKDIRRIRELTYIYPDAIEFIALFLHFYRDTKHIMKPDIDSGPQHQRIIKYRKGMHYKTHPVLTYPNGACSYFTPQLQPFRYVLNNVYIWHLGFVKGEDEIRSKAAFYEKELEKHGDGGVSAHNKKTEDFLYHKEDLSKILAYDGHIPDSVKALQIPDAACYDGLQFENWLASEPYCMEFPPNCWVLYKTGQWNSYSNLARQ